MDHPAKGFLNAMAAFFLAWFSENMNQAELSAYCRNKGLYPEQIDVWRTQCR